MSRKTISKIKNYFNGNGPHFYEIRNIDNDFSLLKRSKVYRTEMECVIAAVKSYHSIINMILKSSATLPKSVNPIVMKCETMPYGYMIHSIFGKIRVTIVKSV